MARTPRIRITKADRKEYGRLVRNTRAKLRRIEENFGVDLSSEIVIPSSVDTFTTRADFNEWKEGQRSFTNRANLDYQFEINKYGVVASKREIAQLERKSKVVKRRAIEERDRVMDLPFYQQGKYKGTQAVRAIIIPEEDVTGIYVPDVFDFDKVRYRDRLEVIEEGYDKKIDSDYYEKRQEQLMDNFIKKLELQHNSVADPLIEMIRGMDFYEFYELYLMYPDVFSFDDYDSASGEWIDDFETSSDLIVNNMIATLEQHQRGADKNISLMDF